MQVKIRQRKILYQLTRVELKPQRGDSLVDKIQFKDRSPVGAEPQRAFLNVQSSILNLHAHTPLAISTAINTMAVKRITSA